MQKWDIPLLLYVGWISVRQVLLDESRYVLPIPKSEDQAQCKDADGLIIISKWYEWFAEQYSPSFDRKADTLEICVSLQ